MNVLSIHRGSTPLLISIPHDGAEIPEAIAARMHAKARQSPDTDWWVSRLYAFAERMGATILTPRYSRYVIDLNRPPNDESLYPGQNTTGLCPTRMFSGEPIYLPEQEPSADEIDQRRRTYWQPYHDALQTELIRLHTLNGQVLLWEAHSILSEVPYLFEGALPDLNIGTADGNSCTAETQQRMQAALEAQNDYSWVINGRFKGGYITRHYAKPVEGIETVQLEIAQCNYLNETTFDYDVERATRLQSIIQQLISAALNNPLPFVEG
jgi:N-formylglutamate deformylase